MKENNTLKKLLISCEMELLCPKRLNKTSLNFLAFYTLCTLNKTPLEKNRLLKHPEYIFKIAPQKIHFRNCFL